MLKNDLTRREGAGGHVLVSTKVRTDRVNFSGRWKLDLALSDFVAPAPRELLVTIRHEGELLEQELAGTRHDGSPISGRLETRTDGSDRSTFLNGTPLSGRTYWRGAEIVVESELDTSNGRATFRDFWSLDPTQEILVMEHRDDPLHGAKSVYFRVAE